MGEKIKKRLGEILIEDGCLIPEDLVKALDIQKTEGGGMIGQILIKHGLITEESLIAAVGKQLSVPYIPLSQYAINSDSAALMGEEFCRKNMILIFDQDEKKIYVATSDPLNEYSTGEIFKKTKLMPQVFITTPTEILTLLDVVFSASAKQLKKAG